MSETTAEKLAAAGLVDPVFDLATIEQDVKGRFELDASLDQLIGEGDAPQPSPFDPGDPS
jgi:hypothetical protein